MGRGDERYEAHLRRIEPELPPHVHQFNDLLLATRSCRALPRRETNSHGAPEGTFPRGHHDPHLRLAEGPVIDPEALGQEVQLQVMNFQYDEFDLVREFGVSKVYVQSIVFSNRWEMTLRFTDVRVALVQALYPFPGPGWSPTPLPSSRSPPERQVTAL